MEKMICANGHYYDGDKYKDCPHCGAGMKAVPPSAFAVVRESTSRQMSSQGEKETKENRSGEKKGLFWHKKDQDNRNKDKSKDTNKDKGKNKHHKDMDSENAARTEDRTRLLVGDISVSTGGNSTKGNEEVTQGFSQEDRIPGTESNEFGTPALGEGQPGRNVWEEYIPAPSENGHRGMANETGNPNVAPEKDNVTQKLGEAPFLRETNVKNESGQPEKERKRETGRTIGYFSTSGGTEPPVGYLICVEGDNYGIGFPLKSGNNSLGRASSMDVVIMDAQVSREKQAFVMYEPHRREFFVRPGDGSGLCYLNDELVMEPKKMEAYDRIQLGNTKLMLIPVCGERFSW